MVGGKLVLKLVGLWFLGIGGEGRVGGNMELFLVVEGKWLVGDIWWCVGLEIGFGEGWFVGDKKFINNWIDFFNFFCNLFLGYGKWGN